MGSDRLALDDGPTIAGPHDPSAEIAEWVDKNASEPRNLGEIIARLTAWTLPATPWDPGQAISPLRGDLDAQCWFWNRAANNLMAHGHHAGAVDVWSALYLAYLSLQQRFHHRYPKGMPLCNLGFAFARAGRTRQAVRCWLLGVVEDALTSVSTTPDAVNYRNLLRKGVAPTVLRQLVEMVESRFLNESIVPLFPESVIEIWRHPIMVAPSEPCVSSLDMLAERLARSYPSLPDPATPWTLLAASWGFVDWLEGVYDGE